MVFKKKTASERLYRADQAARKFCDSHKGELSPRQHKKLGKLLDSRADAISDVLGVRVYSITGRR